MRVKSVYITIIFLIFSLSCFTVSAGISLEQIWQITDQKNLSLMQQEKMISRAEKEIDIQQTGYYPAVSTSAYGSWVFFNTPPSIFQGESKDITLNLLSVSVNQSVFSGFRTKNSVKYAQENLHVQSLQKSITRNTLFLETGNLYYEIQSKLIQQQVLMQSIARIDNQITKIRNLLLAQQATAYDTLELSNKKLQIFTQLSSLKGTTAILESQLKYLINEPELDAVQKPGNILIDMNLDEINNYFQLAMEHRPELQQINAQKKGTGHYASTLEGAYYPVINASGSYNAGRLDGYIFDGSWFDFYNIMLTFQWELWSWNKDKRKVQQVQLESERLDLAQQELLNNIQQQVKNAYQMLDITRNQVYLQQQLAEQEAERFRQTNERFQQGVTTILDLNSAENDLTSAELELEKSKILWHKYKLQLDHATGIIGINN